MYFKLNSTGWAARRKQHARGLWELQAMQWQLLWGSFREMPTLMWLKVHHTPTIYINKDDPVNNSQSRQLPHPGISVAMRFFLAGASMTYLSVWDYRSDSFPSRKEKDLYEVVIKL
jgi:hypothetical protein